MPLNDVIEQSGLKKMWLAANLDPRLTPSEFTQKLKGYKGRKFSEAEREQLAALLGAEVGDLFPETEKAIA